MNVHTTNNIEIITASRNYKHGQEVHKGWAKMQLRIRDMQRLQLRSLLRWQWLWIFPALRIPPRRWPTALEASKTWGIDRNSRAGIFQLKQAPEATTTFAADDSRIHSSRLPLLLPFKHWIGSRVCDMHCLHFAEHFSENWHFRQVPSDHLKLQV